MSSCSLARATTICSFRLPPVAADTPGLLPSPSPPPCMGTWKPALRAGDFEPAGRKKINEQGTDWRLSPVPCAHIARLACGCLNNDTRLIVCQLIISCQHEGCQTFAVSLQLLPTAWDSSTYLSLFWPMSSHACLHVTSASGTSACRYRRLPLHTAPPAVGH